MLHPIVPKGRGKKIQLRGKEMTAQPLPRQTFESRIGLVPGTLLLVELPPPPRQAGFLESEECFESSRALLQTHLDSGALVARHGGRILAVWFPGASADDARKEFERLQVELPGPISAGGTVATGGEEAAVLLDRADRALYQAKDAGRDQVMISDSADVQ